MTLTQTQLKKWPKIKWNLIHFTADQPNQSVINFAQNISKEIKSSNEQRSLSGREHQSNEPASKAHESQQQTDLAQV